MKHLKSLALAGVFLAGFNAGAQGGDVPTLVAVPLPGGEAGIGFDDLGYAPELGRVLAPAGRTGDLDLIDPQTRAVTRVPGFSALPSYPGGHDDSVTSADVGEGLLFATDRTRKELVVLDLGSHAVVSRAALSGSPDYVRYVAPTREIWVTEPDSDQIEVFTAGAEPVSKMKIAVAGGPESLVIDPARMRAYTHLWKAESVEVALDEHRITAQWPNGCAGSRGIALDSRRGFLFAGCAEGRAVVMDLDAKGAILSMLDAGNGVDVISYSARLGHLYLPGAKSQSLAVLDMDDHGKLTLMTTVKTAPAAHCVASDEQGGVWVCDPTHGGLLYFRDGS